MVDRISSGITEIDSKIQGGFPKGSVISYYGKNSRLRKYGCFKFISDSIENQCLYINTRESIEIILEEAKLFHISVNSLYFLDAVHWRTKRVNPKSESKALFQISNLTDLNALLAKIIEACKAKAISRVVFDSPSSVLLYTTPGKEQVYKFFELLTSYLRSNQITMIYTLEEGVHSNETVNVLHYLSDGVLSFEIEDSNGKTTSQIKINDIILTSVSNETVTIENGKL